MKTFLTWILRVGAFFNVVTSSWGILAVFGWTFSDANILVYFYAILGSLICLRINLLSAQVWKKHRDEEYSYVILFMRCGHSLILALQAIPIFYGTAQLMGIEPAEHLTSANPLQKLTIFVVFTYFAISQWILSQQRS